MKKYQLELNENQLRVIEEALEVFSRLGTKQYGMVADHIIKEDGDVLSWDEREKINRYIREIEGFRMPPNASYGIHSKEISDRYRVAFDLLQVARHRRSWANAEHPESERSEHFGKYMGVNYDKPMKTGAELLAVCEVCEVVEVVEAGENQ